MIKLLLSGCGGAMGRVVAKAAASDPDFQVTAGLNRTPCAGLDFPVFLPGETITEAFEVIVDFSHPSSLPSILATAEAARVPVVIATTGFSEDQMRMIRQASRQLPVFFSANMSLGVSLIKELCTTAARVLGGGFQAEIVEKHHNHKIDAPSGTAILLANAISDGLPYPPQYVYDRHNRRTSRGPHEIGIHSIRGGTIVGEHEVIFAGQDEVVTLSHIAYSREVFATGALSAARFLVNHPSPGLYTMADLIASVSN